MNFKLFLLSFLSVFISLGHAREKPFCSTNIESKKPLIVAYMGADSAWNIDKTLLNQLKQQLSHVSLLNYAFIRIGTDKSGHTVLKPTEQDINTIRLIRRLNPHLPINVAIGGWGERESFQSFLKSAVQIKIFVQSVKRLLKDMQLDGVDIDWENESLASPAEIEGVGQLLRYLHQELHPEGYCITNAVPATEAYWINYPDAKLWNKEVDWTTIMAYDHYGTFGPRTEHAAALYENRQEDKSYAYPSTSGNKAIQHYYSQGLAPEKMLLGIPFYCHSYYIKNVSPDFNKASLGLHTQVLDPNISSQINYNEAYNTYGNALFTNKMIYKEGHFSAASFYAVIPLANTFVSRFISCDGPQSIKDKVAYVRGKNSMSEQMKKQVHLAGVSFWSLQQDLPFTNPNSLLFSIVQAYELKNN